jgi:NADH-quinone oxidoreductase subunit L
MVAAGVYLVARAFPIFDAAPVALLVVASIGLITSLMAATMALVMTDIKRIIAYSTITDLGYMMLALGSFGYTAGLFHLLVHGFAKALLFLGAGSVMHGTGGKTDIRGMGGLWRVMPFTAITFAIGAFSLGGIPLFAGFFSKDEILSSVLHGRPFLFFLLALVVAAFKPLYLGRVLFAVFYGRLKEENRHAHESPPVMAVPMAALAFLSIVFGYLALNWTAGYQGIGSFLFFHEPEAFHFNWGMAVFSSIIALVGFYLTWLLYVRRREVVEGIRSRLATAHRILVNKYYMDDLYQWCIDRIVLVFSDLVALFDRVVVNDAGVNGTADSVRLSGGRLRYHISGKMYNYALGIVIGAVVVAIMWWILAPRV